MSKVADAFRRPLVLIETCASFFICKLATSCTCAWILQDARTSFPVRKPQEVLCGGIFEPQCNNFFAAQLKSMNLYQWNGAEKSSKSRCICLQTKTTGGFFPFIRFYFHRFHWKFCRQNCSTGQIKVKRGILLSVWIVFIVIWSIFFVCIISIVFLWFLSFLTVFICFTCLSSHLKEFD